MILRSWARAVAAALALAACSGNGTAPTQPLPPGATQLAFRVQPSQVAAGQAIAPGVQVAIEDGSGTVVTGATNEVSLAIGTNPAGGALSGTTSVAAVSGVATFGNLSIDKAAGGYTLTASSGQLTGVTSGAFSVLAGAPARLAYTMQPGATGAGAVITPAVAVAVQDALGNTVVTATNPVTIAIGNNPAAGTLSGTTTVSAVSGVATFSNLSIDHAGNGYTLVATAGALTAATSTGFAIHAVATAYAAVAAGSTHACAVTTAGAAYCWGYNAYGELGTGTTTNSATPVAVGGGLKFAAVSARDLFTCGLTSSGAAECWGLNGSGQLGTGTTTESTTPAAVTGGLTLTVLSANDGYPFTCGVTAAHAAYCWGSNYLGGLGLGAADGSPHSAPGAVTGSLSLTTVSGGFAFACGLTTTGAGYCWGQNGYGQLGSGATGPQTCSGQACNPTPVAVTGGLTFGGISAGGAHACGVTSAGAAYCWGDNVTGALGIGSTDHSAHTSPVAVSGGLTFATVSAGVTHVCGLTSAGVVYCWGDNGNGELGTGTMTADSTPTAVTGSLTFAGLSAGNRFTCGVTTAGVAYCWGINAYGQLGNGTTTDSSTPVKVAGQP